MFRIFLLLFLCSLKAYAQDWKSLDSLASKRLSEKNARAADSLFSLALETYLTKNAKDSVYADLCRKMASTKLQLSKPADAKAWLLKGKELLDLLPSKTVLYAQNANLLGVANKELGLYAEAVPSYLIAKELFEKYYGKNSLELAPTLGNLAELYRIQGKYADAERYFIEAKELFSAKIGSKSLEYTRSIAALAEVYRVQNQFAKAESLYFEAKGNYEQVLGTESQEYARLCMNIGNVYYQQGLYAKAQPFYVQAKAILEKSFKQSLAYASACSNLGNLYKALGFYSRAEAIFMESKAVLEASVGKKHAEYARFCMNLALLYYAQGEYQRAEPYYLQAKEIREASLGKKHVEYGNACNNLANLYKMQGLYAKAEPLLNEALDVYKASVGTQHAYYASALANLGNLYFYQGLYAKAGPHYEEALLVTEKVLGTKHPNYANASLSLAVLYMNMGDNANAEKYYVLSKDLYFNVFGRFSQDYASSCINLGILYKQIKRPELASSMLEEAKLVMDSLVGKKHPAYAKCLQNSADLAMEQEQWQKADSLYSQSRDLYAQSLGKQHPDYAKACLNWALLLAKQGKKAAAADLMLEACAIMNKRTQEQLPLLSEKERLDYLNSIEYYFKHLYSFGCGYLTEKPDFAQELMNQELFSKALVFTSSQRMKQQILGSGDSLLVKKYEEWKKSKTEYIKWIDMPLDKQKEASESILALEKQVNDMERELSASSELFAKNAAQVRQHHWQELKKTLAPQEAVVEMIRVLSLEDAKQDTLYLALILTAKLSAPAFVLLEKGAELESTSLSYYRTCLALKKEDKNSYNAYWKPIADKLKDLNPKGFAKVYFAPDGVYHQLSLASLKDPQTGKYLNDMQSLQLLGACRDLLEIGRMPAKKNWLNAKQAHLFGYPQYDLLESEQEAPSEERSLNYSSVQDALGTQVKWVQLPGTKKEIQDIEEQFKKLNIGVQSYIGANANETALKQVDRPAVLHIATHGFFLSNAYSKVNNLKEAERKATLSNPLQRCGLAFAGCSNPSQGGDDGILTASEAMNLALDDTELVVLSACETGLGDLVYGEGVFGLQRAFQQAGAKAIIMSLWRVSDEATQLLMSYFYEYLLKNKSKHEAFRLAQKRLMKSYPHPYYWGAFVLVGN